MPIIKVIPTTEYKIPFSTDDERPDTFVEEVEVAGNTAELQVAMGASLELGKDDEARQARLLEDVIKNKQAKNLTHQPTAYAAAAFLRAYGQNLAFDAAQARAAITSKLMEIADCGDTKFELKALELLGKHSDVGLFTERSEITINYKNPEQLENAIKDRVKRLLNADIIDITPITRNLDDELGIASPEPLSLVEEMEQELGSVDEDDGDQASE